MAKEVYVAAVGLTKVDLTGRIFGSIFDLFSDAYARALEDSSVRSFDAVQVGVMDSEEFENRANIATVVVDRLGLTGIPAVRSETASSTGASALHEAYYKIASGEAESVLVLSNNHVLANENKAKKGDAVVQPGPFDKGKKGKDSVARLEEFVPLKSTGSNVVDAAVARLTDKLDYDPRDLQSLGRLAGVGEEITSDYSSSDSGDQSFLCACGAPNCRKFFGRELSNEQDTQSKVGY